MNAKMTKLKKNYVALAALIAALGVIFALFFAINSFADDNTVEANNDPNVAQDSNAEYNYTFTGTAKLYTGDVVPGATVSISRSTTPSGYIVFATGTTDSEGNFSIDATTDAESMNIVVDVNAGGTTTKGISAYTEESTVSAGTVAIGDITCYYHAYLSWGTNPYGDDYGVWSEWMTDHWVEVGSVGGPSGFYYKGDATFTVENTNQVRISFTNRFDYNDSYLYKFDAKAPYTFDGFSFKNAQQQEITGPNITTGYLSMIANCSGQSITHTFSGKFVTPSGSAVSNATVYILANGGSFQTTTNASGEFSKAITVMGASVKITYLGFDLIGDKTKSSISYHEYGDPLYELTADQDAGTLTCYYACGLMEEINGQYTQSNVYGTWSIPAEANDGGVYSLTFNSCEVTVDENKVKFNYVDEKGATKEWVWTFTANPGYEFQNFTFNKENSPVFANASVVDLTTSLFWGINANVTKVVPKHVVTFDNTIQTVFANGHNLTSGEEVAEGSVLTITPVLPTDAKVTKIFVNNTVCTTGVYTLGSSDVSINAQSYDIATITGTVTTDKSANGRAKLSLSNLFVDKAYAAEALQGATVTFTQSSDGWYTSDLTDAEGYFALNVVESEAGILTVTKEGFEPFIKEFSAEELVGEVEVAPVLEVAENTNGTPQTGDSLPYGIALIAIAISAFVFYRTTRKPNGLHIK